MLHVCEHVVLLALLCSGGLGIGRVIKLCEQSACGPGPEQDPILGFLNQEVDVVESAGGIDPRVSLEIKLSLVSVMFFFGWIVVANATALPAGEKPIAPQATGMAGSWAVRLAAQMNIVVMNYYWMVPEGVRSSSSPTLFWIVERAGAWVPMFFVLSGFVAYFPGCREEPSFAGSVAVAGRRYRRYYPMFALGFVMMLMTPRCREFMRANVALTVSTVLCGQAWVYPYFNFAVNGPSWYLSNLIPLAALSPWLSQKVQSSTRPFSLMALTFTTMACLIKLIDGMGEHTESIVPYQRYTIFMHWPIFAAGIVAARLVGDFAATVGSPLWRFGVILALVLVFSLIKLADATDLPKRWLELVYLPPIFCFLAISMAFEQDYFMKLCACVPCEKWLTNSAWCVYIIHVPLFLTFHDTVPRFFDIHRPEGLALLALVASVAASKLFDEPLQAWLAPTTV